jgi:uncharacterized membrane protein
MRSALQSLVPRPVGVLLAVWAVVYALLLLTRHYALDTNAYDLSVFDYALWSTLHGHHGQVPMMGHSLFAHHFMPTLLLLLPAYAVFPSPVFLILVQWGAALVAAVVLHRLASPVLPRAAAAAFVAAFLFSRSAHSAVTGVFYIECLLPALLLGALVAWNARRFRLFAVLALLALGCKEDVAVYLAVFGAWEAWRAPAWRRQGAITAAVALLWMAAAVGVAIPRARVADGLPATNPFIEARYAGAEGESVAGAVAGRLLSVRSVAKTFNATSGPVLLCWLAPETLLPALPGLVLNLAARPDTPQSALTGHYLFPILPWVFAAGVYGAARLLRRWPRLASPLVAVLVLVVVADSPPWLTLARRPWKALPEARAVRGQLARVPADRALLAQANLVPHLPHRHALATVGSDRPGFEDEYVLLTEVGDLWPTGRDGTRAAIARYRADPAYALLEDGPLFVFRRR